MPGIHLLKYAAFNPPAYDAAGQTWNYSQTFNRLGQLR